MKRLILSTALFTITSLTAFSAGQNAVEQTPPARGPVAQAPIAPLAERPPVKRTPIKGKKLHFGELPAAIQEGYETATE